MYQDGYSLGDPVSGPMEAQTHAQKRGVIGSAAEEISGMLC
jgi:hypothetical protein